MAIDWAKVQKHDVTVEEHRVSVGLDQAGKPISVVTACWLGGDEERIAKLAAKVAWDEFTRAAEQRAEAEAAEARRAGAAMAAEESARVRAEAAADHWSYEWLAKAYELNDTLGWSRLRTKARQIAAAAGVESNKRDEISEHYAREFLRKARTE